MKKLFVLSASMLMICMAFTGCSNNKDNNSSSEVSTSQVTASQSNTETSVSTTDDRNGNIDNDGDGFIDDVESAGEDIIEGAGDATKDIIDGITGDDREDNTKASTDVRERNR